MKVPFSPPDITQDEINEVVDTLKSGWITTGPKTKKFENKIAEYCNQNKAVCLNSATACMESILRLLEIGEGDEVITTAYTYTASASVIDHVGAKIVLVDTVKDSFFIDYEKLADSITEKTKAIIAVDLAGIIADYDKIYQIVNSKRQLFKPNGKLQEAIGRIAVISDSAHAFGSRKDGKMCGEFADFTSFSFHAVKNLTTAEGGALTWKSIDGIDDEEIYKKFMLLSLHGQTKDALSKTSLGTWEYDIMTTGYKCNMTDIQASIGLAQLNRYNSMLLRRREIAERYNSAILSLGFTPIKHFTPECTSNVHLYMVTLNNKDINYRNTLINKMAEHDIATNVHYKPLPLLTAYKNLGFNIENYPNAYNMYANEITLPLHTCLTDEQVDYVIKTFETCVKSI